MFIDDVLPNFLQVTKTALDVAAEVSTPIDLQEIFLELTTRLMGKVAYDVSLMFSEVESATIYCLTAKSGLADRHDWIDAIF